MNDTQILGWLLVALGVWIIAASRGAYAWCSNVWRVSEYTADSWIAMVLGPRLVRTLHFILGLGCLLGGLMLALGIV